MINYYKGPFSTNLLFRIHGSGLYRAMIPGVVSVGIFLAINLHWRKNQTVEDADDLVHPYAVGVLVGSVSFLIVFRANFGYQRYWEACGATFQMMSKWLDAATHTACYHLQCDKYDCIKPPSYYDYHEFNDLYLTRDRERGSSVSQSTRSNDNRSRTRQNSDPKEFRLHKSINFIENSAKRNAISFSEDSETFGESDPTPLKGKSRCDGGWKGLFPDGTATYCSPDDSNDTEDHVLGFASTKGGRTPSLFLQELAHLASLMNAVALSTLRNDVEGVESPLDIYEVGSPWPQVDPDKIKGQNRTKIPVITALRYMMSADRTPEFRTAYNSSRPLPVIGGVSDNEIKFLQMARGPSAKTQLTWQWLSEFVTREHLAGSTGTVGPPIISRVFQFLGDGMIFYNHARKIMFIPFPFPHAQLSVFYVLVMVPAVPFLMDRYTNETWLGALLSFFTVTCLAGLHEVARELENPFRNVPNEIPLVTLQAMFNEALITMYAGYHPDAYWEPEKIKRKYQKESPSRPLKKKNGLQEMDRGSRNTIWEEEPDAIGRLQDLIEKQSKEIERLRTLVEDRIDAKDGGGVSNSTK